MVDQIPIIFTSDTGPLQSTAEALKALGAISQDQFDKFNEANAANAKVMADLAARQKEASASGEKAISTLEELNNATKNLSSTIQQGATDKLSQSLTKVKDTSLAAATAHRAHTLEMRELTKAGATADRTMQFLQRTTMSATNAMLSFSMAASGGTESQKRESEQMMKMMGYMQMLMALTETLTALREAGGLKAILTSKLETAAESENIIVKYASIAAQKTLNAVTEMTPWGIILVALAAIGAGFYAWSNQTKATIEVLEDEIAENDKLSESLKTAREMSESATEADIKLAKARGASAAQIHQMTQNEFRDLIEKMNFEIAISRESLEKQMEINKAKLIDHVSFWGSVGTVFQTGFGLWGNMDDKQKEKIEENNKELKKAYDDRLKDLNDLVNKQKDLKSEFLDDKKDETKTYKQELDARKKADLDNYIWQMEQTKKEFDDQKKLDEDNAKQKLQKQKADDELEILLMKETSASKLEILNQQMLDEIKESDGSQLALLKIDQKYEALRITLQKETDDKLKAERDKDLKQEKDDFNKHISEVQKISQEVGQILNNIIQVQLNNQTAAYDKDLTALNKQHDAKQISDQQYAQKKKALDDKMASEKKKAAEEDRMIRIAQAIISTAASILKTGEEMGYPAAIPFQVIAGALGATQIAVMASQKFAKGTKNAPAGFKWVGEEGPELIFDKGGYPIITHPESMKIMQHYEIPAIKHPFLSTPTLNADVVSEAISHMERNQSFSIDYEKLAKHIGKEFGQHLSKEISRIPENKMVFDADGVTEYINTQNFRKKVIKGQYGK